MAPPGEKDNKIQTFQNHTASTLRFGDPEEDFEA
jgi:hypothetical protein